MSEVLHLYCVIGDGRELDGALTGLGGQPISTVRAHRLTAVVSPSPVRAYRSMKRDELVPYLVAHQAVIEQVMQRHTVVPVKFGTSAQDVGEVQKILHWGRTQLEAALESMEGKIELDLVALRMDLNPVLEMIAEDEEIRRQKAAIAGRPPEETFHERVKLGLLVKARLDLVRTELAAEIVEALKPLASVLCPHAVADDRMILNVAFLVDRAKEGAFGDALDAMNGRYADAIHFRCVGPLPPYSFCTVQIRRFAFAEIDQARRLLSLGERLTLQDIKGAYRKLAQRRHPDKVGQGSDGGFEEVAEAYRLLADYCQQGDGDSRERSVRETIAVSLLQSPRELSGA